MSDRGETFTGCADCGYKECATCVAGKTIDAMRVDGFDVEIIFTDGSKFHYESSDGGYSLYEFINGRGVKDD